MGYILIFIAWSLAMILLGKALDKRGGYDDDK